MPDFAGAIDLVRRYPRVYVDTTMVGTPFSGALAPPTRRRGGPRWLIVW